MVFNIGDLLSRFKIRKSPNRQIEDTIRDYFNEKQIIITGIFTVKLQNKKVSFFGDPYVVSYIKLNKSSILQYIKDKNKDLIIEDIT